MNKFLEDAISRDFVEELLGQGTKWRLTYCYGSTDKPVSGVGPTLPTGILEAIPSAAKLRKITRGLEQDKTWVFAFLSPEATGTMLDLQESPL